MKSSLPLVALLALGVTSPLRAPAQETATLSSTMIQSDARVDLGAGEFAPINATGTPFSFPDAGRLLSITSLAITVTLFDGDTGLGPDMVADTSDDDPFTSTLSLRLDGLNTAILLNGFNSAIDEADPQFPRDFIRLRITGTPANAAALLTLLQDNNQLQADVLSSAGDPDDSVGGNFLRIFANTRETTPQPITATLEITGTVVPEPGVCLLVATGAVVLAAGARRRRLR